MTAVMIAAWVEALTCGRTWDESRDAPRIRRAFSELMSRADEWPTPSELFVHLPPIETKLALPSKPVSDEVAQANIEKIRGMLRG